MENNQNMEQPVENFDHCNVNEQIVKEEATCVQNDETGSIYGKFKDATSLLEAYNNLQREFTKKSQKLAELTKESAVENQNNNSNNFQRDTQSVKENNKNEIEQSMPFYKNSSWKNKVSIFFNENPQAKIYTKQISEILLKDKELAKNPNCLSYAYAVVKQKDYKEPAELLSDPKHVEDIIKNEKIKDVIIKNYINSLKGIQSSPRLISGGISDVALSPKNEKPKTIKEASIILKKLLQS